MVIFNEHGSWDVIAVGQGDGCIHRAFNNARLDRAR